jgi:imidazolonepropionase
MKKLAIINCSQLLTLAGPKRPRVGSEMKDLAIINDGAILVDGGLIVRAGKSGEIEPLLDSNTEIVDAQGRICMPGFVDAHTHMVFGGTRADEFEMRANGATYEEILSSGGGIHSTVTKTRAASEEELLDAALKRANWFIRCGTTSVEIKSGYGLSTEDEIKMLKVINKLPTPLRVVPTFLGAHIAPKELDYPKYVDLLIEEMLPTVANTGLAKYCDVFCDRSAFSVEDSRKILNIAKELGLEVRVHADQLSLSGGAVLASELRAKTADHLEHTDEAGIAALKSAKVSPVLLPSSVFSLRKTRYPEARKMIDAGLPVVIATDFNPGSSPSPSMLMAITFSLINMSMTTAEAITASTINPAYTLGLGDLTGSLEAGKYADIVIHDCDDYRQLGYFFGVEHPLKVYINGQLVFNRNTV